MRPSWQLARNELSGKGPRVWLLVAAVALAASLVTGVTCAIGTVQRSVEAHLDDFIGATDARIIHEFNARFDADVLDVAGAWPEVEIAGARLYDNLSLERADGRIDPETEQPLQVAATALGVDEALEPSFRPIELASGRTARDEGEVAIDEITAERLEAGVGDTLVVRRFGAPVELEVVGVYVRPKIFLSILQGPQVRFDRRALAALVERPREINSIAIRVRDGVDVEAFCARYAGQLATYLLLEPALKLRSGFDRRVEASRIGMVIGAVLTFMSAAFIIVTGLTTAVTERQRELAVLRCVGAERRQIFASQLLFGAWLGVAGALIGVPIGLLVARGLAWIYRDELNGAFAVVPVGVTLAVVGAVGAGLAGALFPAWEASRVSPLSAMTRTARPPAGRAVALCAVAGLVLLGAQLALLLLPDIDQRFWAYVYVGVPLAFTAYFLLAVPITFAVARVAGPIASAALRLPAGCLRGTVDATPLRHGFTAGALMVGMSLLVATWAEALGLLENWMQAARFADGFVVKRSGLTPEEQQAVADLPFVEQSCPVGYLQVRVLDQRVFGLEAVAPAFVLCVGFDPDRFFEMNDVTWREGDLESAIDKLRTGEGIIVADRFTVARGIGVGDTLTLGGRETKTTYEIVGAVSAAGLDIAIELFGVGNAYSELALSCVFMSFDAMARDFDYAEANLVQVNIDDTVDDEQAEQLITRAVPGVRYYGGRWIMKTVDEIAFAMLAVQNAIAFAGLVLASLGVGNVILANIHSRRFEYGVMRAVGASRSTIVRLILAEAGLIALSAALTGTVLGMHLATVSGTHYRDLVGLEVNIALPTIPALAGGLLVLAMTLAAAIPGVLMVIRPRPAALVSVGRNG